MAVTGLHNVSLFDSSFPTDSASQPSRQRTDGGVPSHASSILQMWRELEDEHGANGGQMRVGRLRQQGSGRFDVADHSGVNTTDSHANEPSVGSEDGGEDDSECETWSESQIGTHNESEDSGHPNPEQTPGFGDCERQRVRHVLREWMNSGGSRHISGVSRTNNSSSARWLGDKECERVRIVREWVQMNSQQRGAEGREELPAEIGAQLEKVRDGLVVNHSEGTSGQIHRRICRLRGRQALLDILAKAERERQTELQNLSEHHAVSKFPHRNRIQSLLKGRFLRNERHEAQNLTTVAAGELGFLRQRRTVSDLREGFVSRLDTSAHVQGSTSQSDCNSVDLDANGNREAQSNCSMDISGEISRSLGSLSEHADNIDRSHIPTISGESSVAHGQTEDRNDQASQNGESIGHLAIHVGELPGTMNTGECLETILPEIDTNGRSNENSEDDREGNNHPQPAAGLSHSEVSSEVHPCHWVSESDNRYDPEVNSVNDISWQESAEDLREQLTDGEERVEEQLSDVTSAAGSWRNSMGEEMGGSLQISANDQSGQDILRNEVTEQSPAENHEIWDEEDSDETVESQSEGPPEEIFLPVSTADAFFPPDDNVSSLEIRELLSRRSVSSLLQSDFRQNLDRLVQSYVERQASASLDWDLDEMSSSLASEANEQQRGNQNDTINSMQSPHVLPPQLEAQPLWDQDNWSRRNMHQSLDYEWEIVNDLRMDVTALRHRMDNMQRLLEACMDMQLELQRSIRQEVSAALNRACPPELSDSTLPDDGSKWDHVKKGICCICRDNNINALLYRCGHMCTCSNCAIKLVQNRGKCPMCHAPVIEVIRAYLTFE